MGAIFCRTSATFSRIFCALFQISSAFSGGEVLALIRNKFAKLFSGQNPSLFGLFATYIPFWLFSSILFFMKSPSRRSWCNLILPLKQRIKHWCEQNKSFCIQLCVVNGSKGNKLHYIFVIEHIDQCIQCATISTDYCICMHEFKFQSANNHPQFV